MSAPQGVCFVLGIPTRPLSGSVDWTPPAPGPRRPSRWGCLVCSRSATRGSCRSFRRYRSRIPDSHAPTEPCRRRRASVSFLAFPRGHFRAALTGRRPRLVPVVHDERRPNRARILEAGFRPSGYGVGPRGVRATGKDTSSRTGRTHCLAHRGERHALGPVDRARGKATAKRPVACRISHPSACAAKPSHRKLAGQLASG